MNESDLPFPTFPATPEPWPPAPIVPMTFGQILDRIFRLMRSHWKPFLGIGALPMVILFGFYAVFAGALAFAGVFHNPPAQPNTAGVLWTVLPMSLLFFPAMLVIYGLYYGASSYAAVQADHGLPITGREALGHAWSRIGRYVWLLVLRSLIVMVPIAVGALALGAGALLLGLIPKGNPSAAALFFLIPLVILFYVGAFVYAILMSLRLSLAYPACAHEGLTASQAIKRSGVLTRGAKGRIFLMLVVIYAIGYAVVMVLYMVGFFIFAIAALVGADHVHGWTPLTIGLGVLAGLVAMVLVLVWAMLLMAAYSSAFAVFYRDQCLRKDGPAASIAIAGQPA